MSGQIRFISDLHHKHKNMAIKRGFATVEEHDEHIIECWNSVVHKRDTTYILGDLTMEKSDYEFLNRLRGFKKVILGNHDKPQHVPELLKYVNKVAGMMKYKEGIVLTHCPIHPCEMDRFSYNIHGHVHENNVKMKVLDSKESTKRGGICYKFINDPQYINVSAEVIEYTPKTLLELVGCTHEFLKK